MQQSWMKPFHLVCVSTLLLKNYPLLLLGDPLASQPHPSQSCPRAASSWLRTLKSAQCQRPNKGQHSSSCTRSKASMFDAGFDDVIAKHDVLRLTDLHTTNDVMDVIVAGQRHKAKEHVVFFGGDVQDYPENMQSHRDNGKYVRWNSVSTAGQLCERFPTAMVLVMKPHHMHLKTFSVYNQFVQSNDFGCPTHTSDYGAWQSLVQVYNEAVGKALNPAQNSCSSRDGNAGVKSEGTEANGSEGAVTDSSSGPEAAGIPEVPIHLIGFSKGCIVLNQMVHELESVQNNDKVQAFIARVSAMTWLDGGHSGGSNTWVTDEAALKRLASLDISIQVHVTPYQVKDPMRRWIGKEKRHFVELLQKAGAKVTDKLHFEDEPKSIENHFRVLEVF